MLPAPATHSGFAEPAGERISQPDDCGVGGLVDGCGPGDVGVRADQEGVGWSVIGFDAVYVDAMLPVLCDLSEVGAVGEVEEDGPCRVHELRDACCAPVGAQGEVRCEG